MNRVIRACAELGAANPIVSIHDQGAGGNGNVLKEIVEPLGAKLQVRSPLTTLPTLSSHPLFLPSSHPLPSLFLPSSYPRLTLVSPSSLPLPTLPRPPHPLTARPACRFVRSSQATPPSQFSSYGEQSTRRIAPSSCSRRAPPTRPSPYAVDTPTPLLRSPAPSLPLPLPLPLALPLPPPLRVRTNALSLS